MQIEGKKGLKGTQDYVTQDLPTTWFDSFTIGIRWILFFSISTAASAIQAKDAAASEDGKNICTATFNIIPKKEESIHIVLCYSVTSFVDQLFQVS
jgi:hypothetical protein